MDQPDTIPIRVLLADDFPIVRSGIRNILEKNQQIQVVGEATNGQEALQMAQDLNPNVLVLDMELPGIGGIDVARQLREICPDVRVLALSGHDDRYYIQEVLDLGAFGYLIKDEAQDSIVEAVLGVARGEPGWISRQVSASMAAWLREGHNKQEVLAPREMEILKCISEGKTNQAIAYQLGISTKTVEKYIEGILHKLGVASRVEAAVYAVRSHMFDKV